MNGYSTGFLTSCSPTFLNQNLLIFIIFCRLVGSLINWFSTNHLPSLHGPSRSGDRDLGTTVLDYWFFHLVEDTMALCAEHAGFFCATPFNSFLKLPFASNCCSSVATANRSLASTHLQDKISLSIKLSPPLWSETLRPCIFSN